VLRNPGNEEVKRDVGLLADLRALLEAEMAAGSMDDRQVSFRVYLCRAIGEFHLADAMPPLVKAAVTERDPKEQEVRLAALQGIARLIPNIPDSKPRESRELRDALMKGADDANHVVRYHAAYDLGVLGGPEAIARLKSLLEDLNVDVRMNAATGLARYGETACIPELAKMIDPAETAGMDAESKPELRKQKRFLMLTGAFEGTRQLIAQAPTADVQPIVGALDKLLASNPEPDVKLAAEDLKRTLVKQ
jgi:HEAT repeat protein